MLTQYSAGIIVYTFKNGKPHFLLLHHGGHYWNFPKGKIEKGESALGAAFREVEEETGIKPKDIKLSRGFSHFYYYHFRVPEKENPIHKKVTFFLGQVYSKKVFISSEHESYEWCDFENALKKLKFKNSITALRAANEFLKYGREQCIVLKLFQL